MWLNCETSPSLAWDEKVFFKCWHTRSPAGKYSQNRVKEFV